MSEEKVVEQKAVGEKSKKETPKLIKKDKKPSYHLDTEYYPKAYLSALARKPKDWEKDEKDCARLLQCVDYIVEDRQELPVEGLDVIATAVTTWDVNHIYPVSALLRILAWREDVVKYYMGRDDGCQKMQTFLRRAVAGMETSDPVAAQGLLSVKLMAVCTLCNFTYNYLQHEKCKEFARIPEVTEAAIQGLKDDLKLLRKAAAQLTINLALILDQPGDVELVMKLMIAVIARLGSEDDEETYTKIILAAGFLCLHHKLPAGELQKAGLNFKFKEKSKQAIADIEMIFKIHNEANEAKANEAIPYQSILTNFSLKE